MTKTVCFFTDTHGFGGAEQALLTLMAGLDREYWQPVLVYHPTPGVAPLVEGAGKLNVELWPVSPMPDGRDGALRLPRFVRVLRERRPAVFHAYLVWPLACKFGLVAALLARVPAVVATQQLFVEFHLDASIYWQQRLIAAAAGRYLPVSHDLARRLRQRLHIPLRKMQVIHNGIALTPFARPADAALRASLSRDSGRPVILTAARLDEQKGLRYLLEAAASVPEAQFVLAGDGPERASLEAQVTARGLEGRVIFLGFRRDIPELLAVCDLFVLPSIYEGLPISLLEALAAAKPVIATAIGGIDEVVVPGETGVLVPPADSAALATAIRTLLADPSFGQRMAFAGRARIQQEFSADNMVRQVTQVYDDLLTRRKVPNGQS